MRYCLTPASSVQRPPSSVHLVINGRNIPAVPATFGQIIAALLTFSTGLVVGEGGGGGEFKIIIAERGVILFLWTTVSIRAFHKLLEIFQKVSRNFS